MRVTGDIGDSMGLLIGASVITLFEAVDAFAITSAEKKKEKRRPRRSSNTETENELGDMRPGIDVKLNVFIHVNPRGST